MHQIRQSASNKLPIPRKGTKYVARASSHLDDSVPVVIAIRDMLKIARTMKEVEKMIHHKLIKLNGKVVNSVNRSITMFSILEADHHYELIISTTGKFVLRKTDSVKQRLCKVIKKNIVSGGKVQYNLHDGSNFISKDKINLGDSVYIDFSGKVVKTIPLEKGKEVFILSGTHKGHKGKILSIDGKKTKIHITSSKEEVLLDSSKIIAV